MGVLFSYGSPCVSKKINTRRIPTRRVEKNEEQEEIPPKVEEVNQVPQSAQGDQVPILGGGDDVPELSNRDIRKSLLPLVQARTTLVNFSTVPRVNVEESNMTSRLRDFVRINPPICLGSKVGEDPHELLDGVYKVLSSMGVTSREKEELGSYQLWDVS